MKSYAEKLKVMRQQLEMSQNQLAQRTGLTRDRINNYEHGRARIPVEVWESICALLEGAHMGDQPEQ